MSENKIHWKEKLEALKLAVRWLLKEGYGQTMDILNLTILRELPIPLPDYKQQEAIVAEIESRFSIIDKLEQIVNTSLDKAELFRKSILKTAFEGKLVKEVIA